MKNKIHLIEGYIFVAIAHLRRLLLFGAERLYYPGSSGNPEGLHQLLLLWRQRFLQFRQEIFVGASVYPETDCIQCMAAHGRFEDDPTVGDEVVYVYGETT